MAIAKASTHFPNQVREIMKQFIVGSKTQDDWAAMRKIHHHGDEQIQMLWRQSGDFYKSYDDMNLTTKDLEKITAKTFIIQGDRDPFYPIDISIGQKSHYLI